MSAVETQFTSTVGIKYPAKRDDAVKTVEKWLDDKRSDDSAEGLWRIHDEIYDLSGWINKHPGGADWLKWTKGTDITEAFETHHISTLAEEILPHYYVRKAKTTRNYPFTFHENGFYKTLKKRVRGIITNLPEAPKAKTKIATDLLLIGYISCAILSALFYSYILGAVAGMILAMVAIAAHNFFHQRDNFRMFYFDFSLMSSRKWRISHVLSHHSYTNTISDLEISILEPFLQYLPKEKGLFQRIINVICSPGVYTSFFFVDCTTRFTAVFSTYGNHIGKQDILPFLIPVCMYIASGNLVSTLMMWLWILCIGSFHFGLVGINAAHHHPDIFHDGDAPREDRDWGLHQMDAVMDRPEINNSRFLVLTTFGDHALHHLFPTIDHGHLPFLYPALEKTCKEFGIKFKIISQLGLAIGQILQLLRVRPNPNPPGKMKIKNNKTFYEKMKPYRNKDKQLKVN